MTCASTGAESQKTAPSDAWSSPSGGAGLQLGFAMLFVTLEPQPRCHVFDVSTSFKRNIFMTGEQNLSKNKFPTNQSLAETNSARET